MKRGFNGFLHLRHRHRPIDPKKGNLTSLPCVLKVNSCDLMTNQNVRGEVRCAEDVIRGQQQVVNRTLRPAYFHLSAHIP